MTLFAELYGRSCNTLMIWSDLVNRVVIGPDMLADMVQEMKVIKKNLNVAQHRKNSYSYHHRVFKVFQAREHVYLCIKPKSSSLRIGSFPKMSP